MKRLLLCMLTIAPAFLAGCESDTAPPDTPPFPPVGIVSEGRDGFVRISWLRNQEPDMAVYRIWVSPAFDGPYVQIGETPNTTFSDYGATNGISAYYGVTAVDAAGHMSELSTDIVYDTPRPEGSGVILPNYLIDPSRAGYDFSTYSVGPYNDEFTDVFFEAVGGEFTMVVWDDTEIQDMGYTASLNDIVEAPPAGWSPTGDVRLILGHTYVVKTWDNHYAKVRVISLADIRVSFDWAYQLQAGNPRLKPAGIRGPLRPSAGFLSRHPELAAVAGATAAGPGR